MLQIFYYVIFALQRSITMGPERHIIPNVTMAEHECSSFSIDNDNGSDISSPVNSLRWISEYYSMSQLLYYLCISLVQA